MPYINKKDRIKFLNYIEKLSELITSDGELNYCIYTLCINMIYKWGKNYTNLGRCIMGLECAKNEFYRKQIAPYEEEKIKENGDI